MSDLGEGNHTRTAGEDIPEAQLSRREAIQYSGLSVSLWGIFSPLQMGFDLTPRLQHVWIQIDSSGSAEFVAKFESDVNFPFLFPFVSKQRIETLASQGEVDLDLRPVSFDPAGNTPDKRLLSGGISNLASKTTTDGTSIYSVSHIYVDAEQTNKEFPIVNPVNKIKPEGFGSFLTVDFPDGYTYSLPPPGIISGAVRVYEESSFLKSDGDRPTLPFDGSPVDYHDHDEYLSIPEITHRNDPNLAWMQRVAQLKYELLELPGIDHTTIDLYRPTWYGNQAVKKAYQVARHIGKELGKAAIEEVLLYKAPDLFTAPKDVADIAEALNPEFVVPEDDSGDNNNSDSGGLLGGLVDLVFGNNDNSNSVAEPPEEFKRGMSQPLNSVWMAEAVHSDYSFPEVRSSGLNSLLITTQFERAWNHMYASTDDQTKLDQMRTIYVSTLERQQEVASQTRLDIEDAASGPSGEYWEDLEQHAINLCREFNNLATTQIELLENE